ncbi:hypothetical protein ACFV0D_05055 [Streptomyces sp. NPDC059556]|uniref:hypothetical protein n=1 Tax=Streptomyces sp. NPDC059556 TaxID=3346863 RepID=UPI003696FCE8
MSVPDDPAAVERCPEDLVRTVGQPERSATAERGAPAAPVTGRAASPVRVPAAPYRSGLRGDPDDEGPGARDRHAP